MPKHCLILLFILASPWPAFSQASPALKHRKFEAGGFAGGSFIPKSSFSTSVSGSAVETSRDVGMEFADSYQVGFRVGEHFGDFWGSDLEYSFANQPLRFTNLAPSIERLALSQSIHRFSYNVSWLPLEPTSRFRPYAKVGAGAALFYIHSGSKDEAATFGMSLRDDWKFAFNWGGGLKYLIQDQVALSFDVKDQISDTPSYGLPRFAQVVNGQFRPGIASDGLMHNWQLNIGIAFQWDE
jgi:outer membrane protein W